MRKLLMIFLSISMLFSITACGGKKDSAQLTAAFAESESEEETVAESAADNTADNSEIENFTLLDVTEDMIDFGIYATNENKYERLEFVFAKFKALDGSDMVSLMTFSNDDAIDAIICGTYTEDSYTAGNGVEWTLCTVNDVYSGSSIDIGFADTGEEVFILDAKGNPYKAAYISETDTILYMYTVEGLSVANAESATATEDFPLFDISSKMIEAGIYAVDANNNELVFSLFTAPDGTKIASLFEFEADGKNGDVIFGTYESAPETEEDGITWSLCKVSDVYKNETFDIGFGEADGEVYISDADGNSYEGEYLTADETIDYMGTALTFLE